jgi:uncharacterized membrane protein
MHERLFLKIFLIFTVQPLTAAAMGYTDSNVTSIQEGTT